MFANKLVDVLDTTNDKLEFIGKRMWYSHDLASKRASLNDELMKLPIIVNERLDACEIISHDIQKLDMFFSLTHDDRLRSHRFQPVRVLVGVLCKSLKVTVEDCRGFLQLVLFIFVARFGFTVSFHTNFGEYFQLANKSGRQ
ncbi:hypothetical protein LOK49_LG10G01278 [Camellia lanceoleosa]|uniref:Uncharacterized protein n=1 Tax=Camellia lanceoleosa TaxID=1840588 RepID=A0ACC0G8C8_9ERIC|nr:hypothetical protein LOK49_LG10G01278 [Camellia lanceoleosa]